MARIEFKSKPKQLIRKIVFERDNFMCRDCGWAPNEIPTDYTGKYTLQTSERWLEVDHINPVFNGGTNLENNLQTLCNRCNSKKGVKTSE